MHSSAGGGDRGQGYQHVIGWRNRLRRRDDGSRRQQRGRGIAACLGRAPLSVLAGLVLLVPSVGTAVASVEVGVGATNVTLRVDSVGDADVSWDSAGAHRSLLIARDGSLHYGAGLVGPDVSHPSEGVALPWKVTVRQTPDGSFYAVQAWRRLVAGPIELRFSRWKGEPTKLVLDVVCCKWGSVNVEGSASFHGKPIFGYSATPQGSPLDPFGRNVYLDSFRDGHWERMMGILTHRPTGTFSLWIRANWSGTSYRGTIPGPNWGWTLAPDAAANAATTKRR